jgi:sugar lactone lactonase YvrE
MSAIERAVAGQDLLGESPVWSVREQALWWVDIRSNALRRFEPATGDRRDWVFDDLCCGVALAHDGLILVTRHDLLAFDPSTGATRRLLQVEDPSLDNRLNEARVDPVGRLIVGSMRDYGAAVTGSIYAISADRHQRRLLADIRIPNAMAWSPDGLTFQVSDTGERTIRAYDYDPGSGDLTAGRTLLAADVAPGLPDGSAMDVEGAVWNARPTGGCLVRVLADGRIRCVVALPVSHPTACAFGGPDLKTLYITTARQRLTPEALAPQPWAGSVLSLRVDAPGLPANICGLA